MQRRQFLAAAAACATGMELALARPVRPVRLAAFDPLVKPLVKRMTLAEKIGQMAQGELNQIKDEADIERYFLGSVLSGGDADPAAGNSLQAWTETVDRLISRSRRTRLGIPILYGIDAVHGHNNLEGAVIFPHNIGMGCTNDPQLVEQAGRITALEMLASGIRWTFAPCIAVPQDERWGRTYEGYSEDPARVSRMGAAAIRGLQSPRLGSPRSVLACAKHFVGDGGTSYEPRVAGGRTLLLDQGNTQVDEATLRRIHLPGYIAAIKAGVGSIMVSYSRWNGVRVSASHRLLTEILKNELGFEGFVVSDYYAIDQIDRDYRTAVAQAINAGMDMAMEPARYAQFIETLTGLVSDGTVSLARIEDAVTRILRVKSAMGLLDPHRPQLADRSLQAEFGSAAHRKVARQAVRQSLVLLKNAGNVLPLSARARHIHVAGRGADDLGIQCGGWTITWQGRPGKVTTGTTIREAIQKRAGSATQVSYSMDGSGAKGADVAVVVVGEMPYAEGVGDRSDLHLAPGDLALIDRVHASGVPVVLMLLSGRPLILGHALDQASAVLAAWLPGTEGDGISDVLFGDHAPSGKLGFSWPASMAQIPLSARAPGTAPLFPLGFGLTYSRA